MPDSTKNPISILLRAPVTMKIGPVPADLTSSDQIMSFGLNNFARILSEKGIAADVDGDRSEEHTSELQSIIRTSYAHLCTKQNLSPSMQSEHYWIRATFSNTRHQPRAAK